MRCLALVVVHNTWEAWMNLAMLPKCVLSMPAQKAQSNQQAAAAYTLDRLARWEAGERMTLWEETSVRRDTSKPLDANQREDRAVRLCKEEMDGKACATLTAPDMVTANGASVSKLRRLHPAACPPAAVEMLDLPLPPDISVDIVLKMLRSFPRGSAPGPTGRRAQHILEALTPANKTALLEQLAAVTRILSSGQAPDSVAPYFAGAKLFAAEKKDGGIRPIAVGDVLRRLTGKCLSQCTRGAARAYFWPLQVGCGSPLGAETAVHVLRQWCERHAGNQNKVVLKLDFRNAFNCVNRGACLREVSEHFPGLSRFVRWCYGSESSLFFDDYVIESQTGVQQGDPLGPLMFSAAIHPLVKKLRGLGQDGQPGIPLDLVVFYLDDGVVCGSADAVAAALRIILDHSASLGLDLNLGKSELIVLSESAPECVATAFPRELTTDTETGQQRVLLNGCFEILGAPIGHHEHCARHTRLRVEKAVPTLDALSEFANPQVGLRLLRVCASFGKLVYSCRSAPSEAHHAQLQGYDEAVRAAFVSLTGIAVTDGQWLQACRSISLAGLGLRSTAHHSSASYVASRSATSRLCREVDSAFEVEQLDEHSALGRCVQSLNAQLPEAAKIGTLDAPIQQRKLSQALDQVEHDAAVSALSASDRASVLSEMLPGASHFLDATPSDDPALRWEPAEFITELRTRLQADVYPADDPRCDDVSDAKGHHARSCPCGGDRTSRHHASRNLTEDLAGRREKSRTREGGAAEARPRATGQQPSETRGCLSALVEAWSARCARLGHHVAAAARHNRRVFCYPGRRRCGIRAIQEGPLRH